MSFTGNKGKTAVRHGDKDGWINFLVSHGFDPQITEANQSDLKNLSRADRYYGFLVPDSQILLIDSINTESKNKVIKYWLIMI